ncbi:MAG: CHAT domain-containing protein [Phycisphaerae bacterium]|nr:CHAT domain-containing protein [Phycisphaerae bacterium]
MSIPLREHVWALRDALAPWVKWEETAAERLHHVKEYLTVLPEASLEEITAACAEGDYTHVHILAHGADYEHSGVRRFGVALNAAHDKNTVDIVGGRKLAAALRTTRTCGQGNSQPSVVTLATCDSGNAGSVVAPGGSIAHDLHAAGIPWVFASQFPLTKRGSVKLTRNLYSRLLHGDDPRRVLHEVRNLMYLGERGDHDWASLIAYASIPSSFSQEVSWFRMRQTRDAIRIDLDRASRAREEDVEKSVKSARKRAADWRATLPPKDSPYQKDHDVRVECLGISGATEKQLAELFYNEQDHDKELEALEKALHFYEQAITEKADSYWPASQYLSLSAILGRDPEPALWMETLHGVERNLTSNDQAERAWTYGTIAELELLGVYHLRGIDKLEKTPAKVKKSIIDNFKKIVDLAGRDSFNVFSTWRQFTRYCEWWNEKLPALADIARPVLKHLPKGASDYR